MSDKIIENNQVTIMGEVASAFSFSHEVFGEGFYMVDVNVKRLSNSEDKIPVMISERLIDVREDYTGQFIMVSGQFRSYNRHDEQKNRLVLSVFAREVSFIEPRQTVFCWMVTYVSFLFIGKLLLEERLQTFCLQSTGHMESRITYLVSVGEETHGSHQLLR